MNRLVDDELLTHLMRHLGLTASAVRRRVHDLGSRPASDEAIVAWAVRVARKASAAVAERQTGQVIDLAAARAARVPHPINHVLAFLADDVVARMTALARQQHGEANDATKSLVLAAAIARGLEALELNSIASI